MKYLGSHARERATYQDGPSWPPQPTEEPATDADVARFLAVYPETTCTPKMLRLLAALMRDFAPEKEGADAPHRTPGDPGPTQ